MNLADIERAAAELRSGGLVAFPTETVYGLGAHALSVDAVCKVFELKARPRFDPLIVHTENEHQAFALAEYVPEAARRLATRFWPGPLTLVLEKRSHVPDLVTAGLPSVALRVPAHPVALQLLHSFGGPIAAPSANRFGRLSPTQASHVREEFGEQTPLLLDGGACRTGVESTIVSLLEDPPVLLRPGGVSVEALESVLGVLSIPRRDPEQPSAPGQLPSHYAPRTPLILLEIGADLPSLPGRLGLLSPFPVTHLQGFTKVEILSPTLDLSEAARNLFGALRRLDSLELDTILARPAPSIGLGLAINDRLHRASQAVTWTRSIAPR